MITEELFESLSTSAASVGSACSNASVGVVPVVFTVCSGCFALVDVVVRFENFPWAPSTSTYGANRFRLLLLLLPWRTRFARLAVAATCGSTECGCGGAGFIASGMSNKLMLDSGGSSLGRFSSLSI